MWLNLMDVAVATGAAAEPPPQAESNALLEPMAAMGIKGTPAKSWSALRRVGEKVGLMGTGSFERGSEMSDLKVDRLHGAGHWICRLVDYPRCMFQPDDTRIGLALKLLSGMIFDTGLTLGTGNAQQD
jgi:hypothetical protein